MTEKLLQFIWQFQHFNVSALTTTSGDPLQISAAGTLNTNQGPDFEQARIIVGTAAWAGSVELHIRSSDWLKHEHQNDERYNKVILHVVWQHDMDITDSNGNLFPTLSLESRVSKILLDRYEQWMQNAGQIPCAQSIGDVPAITWHNWKERLLVERMLEKYAVIQLHLSQTGNHWEEVCWRMICRYFGGNINRVSFEQLAVSLPIGTLAKHKNQIHQLEALLLGQAGLLHSRFEEDYPRMLFREYQFLQHKYQLRVINLPPSFLRMRPANFPTVRLAQLGILVQKSQQLFSKIKEAEKPADLQPFFDITANDYWHYHYKFDETSDYAPKKLGSHMWDTLLINAIIPLLFAFGVYHNDDRMKDKALQWLEQTGAEKNSVIKPFTEAGIGASNAFDSQALLQLKKNYCDAKRCLECAVGNAILKRSRE